MTYPDTTQVDVADEYFGQSVADPYRWLENDIRQDAAVSEWVEAQMEYLLPIWPGYQDGMSFGHASLRYSITSA